MIWTDEAIETLLSLYRSGWTYTQIAAHLGCSKNSVSGKLDRVLKKSGERVKRPANAPITVPKRKYQRSKPVLTLPDRAESVSPYVAPKPVAPDEGQLASIVDVTGCKWPVREDASFVGGHALCNHAVEDLRPYCAYHAKLAVAPYSRKLIGKTLGSLGLRFGKRAA